MKEVDWSATHLLIKEIIFYAIITYKTYFEIVFKSRLQGIFHDFVMLSIHDKSIYPVGNASC